MTKKITKIVGFQSGHDVAYCILENGIPVLVEEWERISRKKMEDGDGLKFFFSRPNDTHDIKYFTLGNWKVRRGRLKPVSADVDSDNKMKRILSENGGEFYEFSHHLCHAANAFYTSNFDKSLIITMDAGGWENENFITCFSIREGIGNKINTIKVFKKSEANLGTIWWEMTKHVFGLSVGYPKGDQAGTVMAMATLGEPKYMDLLPNYSNNIVELKRIANISEQEKFNIAASLQEFTEINFRKIVSEFMNGHENLCISGGVSLNCVMIGKIRKWFPNIKNVFADPIPYDAGLALGSARYLWHHVLGNPRVKNEIQNMSPYLGRTYSKDDIMQACDPFSDKINLKQATDEEVVNKIYDQKIIAVYGGGAEHGRRALGNRSILADPQKAAMKAQINARVKHRQWFRPLAPAILEEKINDWFEDAMPSPYMSFALKFKVDKQNKVPAVVHYDGTGRLQTVNKDLSPWFHGFITKWEVKSGVPIIVNTSFNDSEPIVETPEDALNCFLGTDIDYLYFFDYGILVEKT